MLNFSHCTLHDRQISCPAVICRLGGRTQLRWHGITPFGGSKLCNLFHLIQRSRLVRGTGSHAMRMMTVQDYHNTPCGRMCCEFFLILDRPFVLTQFPPFFVILAALNYAQAGPLVLSMLNVLEAQSQCVIVWSKRETGQNIDIFYSEVWLPGTYSHNQSCTVLLEEGLSNPRRHARNKSLGSQVVDDMAYIWMLSAPSALSIRHAAEKRCMEKGSSIRKPSFQFNSTR